MHTTTSDCGARALGLIVATILGTGIATTIAPAHTAGIITTVTTAALLLLAVKLGAWRVREQRRDRADALTAARARAAHHRRQHTAIVDGQRVATVGLGVA